MPWTRRFLVAGLIAAGAAITRAAAARRQRDATNAAEARTRIRRLYDAGAARYDAAMHVLDAWLFEDGRRWVAGRASGRVLEIAAGSARNVAYYPSGVRLVAQDLSLVMLQRARARAAAAGRDVPLHAGDAQALAFADATFDTVVCTLGLCTIPDERQALRETWRVLKPGGRLLWLEHVRSTRPVVAAVQRAIDPVICLLASDHLLRDPLPVARGLGFDILRAERSALALIQRVEARKPEGSAPPQSG